MDGWLNNREDGGLRRHRAHYDCHSNGDITVQCRLTNVVMFPITQLSLHVLCEENLSVTDGFPLKVSVIQKTFPCINAIMENNTLYGIGESNERLTDRKLHHTES